MSFQFPMPTSTVENYLKAALRLEEGGQFATVGGIAEELAVTPGTVTTMMKHLASEGLVDYAPRKQVSLTESGRAAALQVLRRHRLIETFLVEIMKLDWAHVHEEAEVLEHVISDRLVERMDEMLGRPDCDPHGSPIPDARGVVSERGGQPLCDCRVGDHRLLRVQGERRGLLDWLQERELVPGVVFSLEERDDQAGVFSLQLASGRRVSFDAEVAGNLWVGPAR
ncbi:MAG: metal-dependent transcriptional regulator [Verrucomicrobiota bacterium]